MDRDVKSAFFSRADDSSMDCLAALRVNRSVACSYSLEWTTVWQLVKTARVFCGRVVRDSHFDYEYAFVFTRIYYGHCFTCWLCYLSNESRFLYACCKTIERDDCSGSTCII